MLKQACFESTVLAVPMKLFFMRHQVVDKLKDEPETIIGNLLNEVDKNESKDVLSDEFSKFL